MAGASGFKGGATCARMTVSKAIERRDKMPEWQIMAFQNATQVNERANLGGSQWSGIYSQRGQYAGIRGQLGWNKPPFEDYVLHVSAISIKVMIFGHFEIRL